MLRAFVLRMETGSGRDGVENYKDPDAFSYAWAAVERKRKEHAELELGVDDAGRRSKRLKKTGEAKLANVKRDGM